MEKKQYTVSEINEEIRNVISSNFDKFVNIIGEISNLKQSNGNTYFTLKDNDSSINVIFWKKETGIINNGNSVCVNGKIGVYPKNGVYQIYGFNLKNIGLGELHLKYENLKNKFQKKGYFDNHRPLPNFINRIGIITSLEGAAIQDILYVFKKNNFYGEVIIKNCSVQGENCPNSIKEGIKYFTSLNKTNKIDLILITRGGGAFEDLMGFSDKKVVKAIYKCPIVVISAVGHETDNMLSDFSSDIRTPTPSIAGELISAKQREHIDILLKNEQILNQKELEINFKLNKLYNLVNNYKYELDLLDPHLTIDNKINKLKELDNKLLNNINYKIEHYKIRLKNIKDRCKKYNVSNMLNIGANIILHNGNVVKTAKDFIDKINKQEKLIIKFIDKEIDLFDVIKDTIK
jgi:exodeoxyribonuclease VII large subunit